MANLIPVPGFESGTTGWSSGSNYTLTQDATHVNSGSQAGKCVAGSSGTPTDIGWKAASVAGLGLTNAALYEFYIYVWIPAAWSSGTVKLSLWDFTANLAISTVAANMGLTNQWQQIIGVAAANSSANQGIRTSSGLTGNTGGGTGTPATAGDTFWVDDAFLDLAPSSPFPTTGILDSFNRADGALGSNWSAVGADAALAISSNQVEAGSAGVNASGMWNVTTYGPDMEAYADVPVLPVAGDWVQLRGRQDSTSQNNVYFLRVTPSTSTWEFRKIVGGGGSVSVGSFTHSLSALDSFGLRCLGTQLQAWWKPNGGSWTLVGLATDSGISAAGYAGITIGGDQTARLDNFGGGTVPVGGAPKTFGLLGVGA